MDTVAHQSQKAIAAIEKVTKHAAAPVRLLRRARAAALGSRFRALTVEDFEEMRPVIGCILPDWKDSSLPEHTRAQVSKQVATRLQTVRDVAASTCGVWMEKHRQAMGSAEQREQAMGWLQRTFGAWRKEAIQQQNNNIISSPRRNTKRVTRGTKAQQQQQSAEAEVRKETPVFRDTPRGRRCKDFTDDAGYLRSEWARLRLAMLRDTRERHKSTTQQRTMDSTTRTGTTTSAVQPNAPS